uniref:palmitoyl-protein hydrolase n=1 Tax=Glossina brevipalpis TaxID=37001 RepID=A0A1A9WTW9_9MUSC
MMKLRLLSKSANNLKHNATVIFLHGTGDTGPGIREWVHEILERELEFPHIKMLYPTAPLQSYTPIDGELSTVWFDRPIAMNIPENRKTMEKAYDIIRKLINNEIKDGIPVNRIIVGGFSMGGALALHAGYHVNRHLAGIIAYASFINNDSIIYETLERASGTKFPELLMFHGGDDPVIPLHWSQHVYKKLRKLGVQGQFKIVPDIGHDLEKHALEDMENWISKKLFPLKTVEREKLG